MELVEILLKIVLPISIAIFIFLKKKEISRMLSNFSSTSDKTKYDTDPNEIAEKLDIILRHYNE